jgi:hypothetical protein
MFRASAKSPVPAVMRLGYQPERSNNGTPICCSKLLAASTKFTILLMPNHDATVSIGMESLSLCCMFWGAELEPISAEWQVKTKIATGKTTLIGSNLRYAAGFFRDLIRKHTSQVGFMNAADSATTVNIDLGTKIAYPLTS